MTKQCQSCGMPLKKDSDKGTETDGSLSVTYCAMCYENGAFTDPDATPQQMQNIAERALKGQACAEIITHVGNQANTKTRSVEARTAVGTGRL